MNRRDLEAAQKDGTSLAYVLNSRRGMADDYAQEVRVINPSAPRQVYTGARHDFGGHSGTGVLIEFVGKTVGTTGEPLRDTVSPVRLPGTWAKYTELRAARQARADEQKRARDGSQAAAEAAAEELRLRLIDAGVSFDHRNDVAVVSFGEYHGRAGYRPPAGYGVRVAPAILNRLMGKGGNAL